jgi:hypothetical protein
MSEKTLILLFMAGTVVGGFSLGSQLNSINKEVERVQVESIVSSGKAIYMPGSVCILKATSEVSEDKMREFAAACIKSHKDWLLISNDASNYNDAPEQTPSK